LLDELARLVRHPKADDAGHFSTLTEHAAEILDDLVRTAREHAPLGS
jgi:hypothetical protein